MPEQMAEVLLVAETVGKGSTESARVVVFEQPAALRPVNVYTVEALGVKETLFTTPCDHEYVLAPWPQSTTLFPIHTIPEDAEAVKAGSANTLIEIDCVLRQPNEFVTCALNTDTGVIPGDTVITDEEEGGESPIHVKVGAPVTVRVSCEPKQILGEDAAITGPVFGSTVIKTVWVPEQPLNPLMVYMVVDKGFTINGPPEEFVFTK